MIIVGYPNDRTRLAYTASRATARKRVLACAVLLEIKAMFSSKFFSRFLVTSMFGHMHGALNVDEILITQFVRKLRDESFESN
jgi:hypothetical protein